MDKKKLQECLNRFDEDIDRIKSERETKIKEYLEDNTKFKKGELCLLTSSCNNGSEVKAIFDHTSFLDWRVNDIRYHFRKIKKDDNISLMEESFWDWDKAKSLVTGIEVEL